MNLPNHIAIIMDGNGRWGKRNLTIDCWGMKKVLKILRK